MVAIPITRPRSLVVGSPEYFKGRSKPIVPLDLVQHRCIQMRMANGRLYRWEFERRGEAHVIDVPGNLTLDATDLILAAALSGAGLAYIGEYSLAAHMAAGHPIPVLEEWCPAYPGLSLYFSQRRHMPAKLRAFIDLIREQAV
ncbi:transcriptional regulator [Sinorhizobium meliloti]|uniref:LysR substrate-binding domain-containing protein n=1 Tax=Rhizobium meliloti TaxID=382 RepID=UPI000FD3826F|nr:LysR substrate-binding domain-containing protein [Sinorhizobium meliloti]MDW9361437.1 transcriptional regulator [Sinorhizobium meliloti]MDW9384550.1 transcriptional regulator [Sinorhizobium meliloti]MDW9396393.1 transcriptional regulator [Sinorhizobium meliloti]MDW9536182.1 transcriptional regulator [Sinorhizobium meliloti]MDX0367477.1 transcriptional regulator [Sinorhizobium meliloti]